MIITCPSCNKKFNVDASLIPQEGRTLQCGFCDRKWFFKAENTEEEIKVLEKKISKPVIEDNKNLSENIKEDIIFDTSYSSLIEPSFFLKNHLRSQKPHCNSLPSLGINDAFTLNFLSPQGHVIIM